MTIDERRAQSRNACVTKKVLERWKIWGKGRKVGWKEGRPETAVRESLGWYKEVIRETRAGRRKVRHLTREIGGGCRYPEIVSARCTNKSYEAFVGRGTT